jgi:decaprenylphospho-beta-D-ribofuranose 2-oxidase
MVAADEVVLTGWGRTAPTRASVAHPATADEVAAALADPPQRGVIARGLGRSYNDAAQNAGGLVLDCTELATVRDVDLTGGVATVDGGVSLDLLMRQLVPLGWFVPVTPGTRHVTVGGAIAADIHGKNHHHDGTFGAAVERLTLQTPTGVRRVERDADKELFWATAGGMGLTGVVVDATIRLRPVETALMVVDTDRTPDLDTLLELMTSGDHAYEYSVAWLDCLARGARLGRGVLTRGRHARLDDVPAPKRSTARRFDPHTLLKAPPWTPAVLLNRASIAAFNELWFRKAPRHRTDELQPLASFFHPLDGVEGWNRLYGTRGFVQYQFVVPFGAEDVVRRSLELLGAARCPSFFAVLKRFGPANPGPLSFPTAGWTLALDVPARVEGLGALLDAIDELVVAAGGRVYLAKDARVRPELVPVMYPRLDEWRDARAAVDPEGVLTSDLARRLRLLEGPR